MGQLENAAPSLRDLSILIKFDIMGELRNEVMRELRKLDPKRIFKNSTGALLNSISSYMIQDRLVFTSYKEYFGAQEYGNKERTMWYLLGKTIPIGGKGGGTPLYRKCTLKSIMNGGWRYPARPGKYFLRGCIERALERLPMIVSMKVFAYTGVVAE